MIPLPTLRDLCAADRRVILDLLTQVQAYAEGRLDEDGRKEIAERLRLPSLRGFLPKEERPYIRLELIPAGWCPDVHQVTSCGVHAFSLDADLYVLWREERGEEEFVIARGDRDKYGEYDTVLSRLPGNTVLILAEDQAESLGLPQEDVTLEELLAIRYAEQFMPS